MGEREDNPAGPRQMTNMEKLANNLVTIVVARAAMVATPFVGFLLWYWLDSQFTEIAGAVARVEARVGEAEQDGKVFKSEIQDHEARITFNKQQDDVLKAEVKEQFDGIGKSLEAVKDKLGDLNGNVISLRTIISERVPKPDARSDGLH